MRLDLYTSADRAKEAYQKYKARQWVEYNSWATLSAALIMLFAVGCFWYFNPFGIFKDVGCEELLNKGIPDKLMGVSILVWLIGSLILRYLAMNSVRVVALYQGLLYGILGGAAGVGASYIISQTIVSSIIIGVVTGVIITIFGLMGGFLPDF